MMERRCGSKHIHYACPRRCPAYTSRKVGKRVRRVEAFFKTFSTERLPWYPFKVVLNLDRLSLDRFWWVGGIAVFRLVWLVLVSRRGGSIARNGIIIPILLFVVF